MVKLLTIGLGGFAGAVARYLLSGLAYRVWPTSFPVGTLAVNVLGCLLIGAAMALVGDGRLISPNARLLLLVGLLGSFTTFATFGYETTELLAENQYGWATLNVGASVVLGLGSVVVGRGAVRLLLG